jgi:hypothetical protein
LQQFYASGAAASPAVTSTFPTEFDLSDTTDWGKYNPDIYQLLTPVITAVPQFQASP